VEQILGASYNHLTVLDAQVSTNGAYIIVALKCPFGKLSTGSVVSSKDGKHWEVVDNELRFQSEELEEQLRQKEEQSIFLYEVKGIGHTDKPLVGQKLLLVPNVS
jgi:hypothetical protein